MKTIREILNDCGGTMEIARHLELQQVTVEGWKRTGIPWRHLLELKRKYGINSELIEKLNTLGKHQKNAGK